MTRFEKWLIGRVFKRDFTQGPKHSDNISDVYSMIREICAKEFTEDNEYDRDAHLRECFESTQFRFILPEFDQAKRMEKVAYDLHNALGIVWGDDPYLV